MNNYLVPFERSRDLVNSRKEKMDADARVAHDIEVKRRIREKNYSSMNNKGSSKDQVQELDKNEAKIKELQLSVDNKQKGGFQNTSAAWRAEKEIQRLKNANSNIIKDSGVIEDMKTEKYYDKMKNVRAIAPQLQEALGMEVDILETDTDGVREFTWQDELSQNGIVINEKEQFVYQDSGARVKPEVIKEIESDVKDAMDKRVHGFISDPTSVNGKDKRTIVINKQNSLNGDAVNVAGHEFLHALLFKTLNNNPGTAMAVGKGLERYLNNLDFSMIKDSEFMQRLYSYQTDAKRKDQSFEETLTLFSDAIASGDIKYSETVFDGIGDVMRRVFNGAGSTVTWSSGKDVFNFIKDYNHAIERGKAGKFLKKVAKGVTLKGQMRQHADIYQDVYDKLPKETKEKMKFSKGPKEFENTIQALYEDGNIDMDTKAFLIISLLRSVTLTKGNLTSSSQRPRSFAAYLTGLGLLSINIEL